ncbi:MAG: hypothetical protein JST00_10435 [Deltaproteobacteria bacterium]|nr:hypothetical protein [Deltaproteobacteria bacterium]
MAAVGAVGCGEREPYNAYDVAAANQFQAEQRAQAMKQAPADPNMFAVSDPATVRCRCDAEGGLHVTAPEGARVRSMTNGDREDAEAEIALADRPAGTRIRRTVSLGYVGDAPLTQVPSRGGPWNVPDALLPPHQHVEPRYPSVYTYGAPFYGYAGGRGFGGYGYGAGGSRAPSAGAGGAGPQPRGGLYFTPHIHQGGSGGSAGGSRPAPAAPPSRIR